jgi:histidinol-phosphate/aromatic aminotransferase/cobyric acid decarboxylase-like protein
MAMTHGGNVWQGASPGDWLDFSANLRPEGPPDWVTEAMAGALGEARYYPDVAMRATRAGLAAYAGVPPECVLPTAGGVEAIDLICRAGVGRVLTMPPTFGEYARRARVYGREDAPFQSPEAVRRGDVAFLCNPNNPTGEVVERDRVLELAGEIRRAGGALAVDEAFIDLCPEESVRDRAARTPGLVVVGSLTKALCIPGARLGYLIAAPAWVERFGALAAPWSLNAFAAAVARALPEHLHELAEDRRLNDLRREALSKSLAALGAKVLPSKANFLLCDFGRPMTEAVRALMREGILVRECASFGLPANFLRLAVRTEGENARLAAALERALA